jgi:hypothetical protein
VKFQEHRAGKFPNLTGKGSVGNVNGPVWKKIGGGKRSAALSAHRPLFEAFFRDSIFRPAAAAGNNQRIGAHCRPPSGFLLSFSLLNGRLPTAAQNLAGNWGSFPAGISLLTATLF